MLLQVMNSNTMADEACSSLVSPCWLSGLDTCKEVKPKEHGEAALSISIHHECAPTVSH